MEDHEGTYQPERWLSVEQIAAHLGISKETVYKWLDKGAIPSHRIGHLWKFRASEVDKWVEKGNAGEKKPRRTKRKPKSMEGESLNR